MRWASALARRAVPCRRLPAGMRRIPVVYDGPDLAEVAELVGLSEAELIDAHAAGEHRVLFGGFAPGFAYVGGLPRGVAHPAPRHAAHANAGRVGGGGRRHDRHLPRRAAGWLARHRPHAGDALRPASASHPAYLEPGDLRALRADPCR